MELTFAWLGRSDGPRPGRRARHMLRGLAPEQPEVILGQPTRIAGIDRGHRFLLTVDVDNAQRWTAAAGLRSEGSELTWHFESRMVVS